MAAFPWNKASEPSKQPARPADAEKAMSKGMETKMAPPAPPAAPQSTQQNACVLGPTLHFKGELYGEEDLEFQGQLEGSIEHTRSLTIGKDGGVTGNIKAKFVIVEGRVDGDIHATESVQVRTSAKVNGNIFAPRVSIAEGANFSGRVDMSHKGTPVAQPRPQATLSDRAAESLIAKTAS